jgi:ATP adenylyltransferase
MDQLWSPWRLAYITGAGTPTGCVFCPSTFADAVSMEAAAARQAEFDSLVLSRTAHCFVILNLFPYNNGHLMVVPHRHISSLSEATAAELAELIELTRRAEIALTEAYEPHGMNMGINLGRPAGAGVLGHVHMHVVPRWNGDTNFMTVVGETRVLPEELPVTGDRLRPIFERLAGARSPSTARFPSQA